MIKDFMKCAILALTVFGIMLIYNNVFAATIQAYPPEYIHTEIEGDTVIFTEGVYTSRLLPIENCTYISMGAILDGTNNDLGVEFRNVDNVKITGFEIRNCWPHAIGFGRAENTVIENCDIHSSGGPAGSNGGGILLTHLHMDAIIW
jgi:hypothetical protein